MAINPQSAYWKLRFQLQSSVAKNWSLKPLHFTIWISISSWKTQNKKQKLANGHSFQKAFGFSCSIMWVLHVIIHPLEKHLVWPQTIPKARPTFGPSWGAAREPAIRKKASEIYPAKLVLIRLCQKFLQCHLCQKKTDMVPKKKLSGKSSEIFKPFHCNSCSIHLGKAPHLGKYTLPLVDISRKPERDSASRRSSESPENSTEVFLDVRMLHKSLQVDMVCDANIWVFSKNMGTPKWKNPIKMYDFGRKPHHF